MWSEVVVFDLTSFAKCQSAPLKVCPYGSNWYTPMVHATLLLFLVWWNFDGWVKVNELSYSHPTTLTIIHTVRFSGSRFKELPELFLEAEGLTLSPDFCAGCLTHFSCCFQDLGDNHRQPYRIHSHVLRSFSCPHFRLGLRISSSTTSGVVFSFFRCETACCRSISGTLCLCVLWFVLFQPIEFCINMLHEENCVCHA